MTFDAAALTQRPLRFALLFGRFILQGHANVVEYSSI
jgi:hypothetical protein